MFFKNKCSVVLRRIQNTEEFRTQKNSEHNRNFQHRIEEFSFEFIEAFVATCSKIIKNYFLLAIKNIIVTSLA